MRGERGQASVEWIGLLLLVAVAVAALTHFAPRADGRDMAATVLAPTKCAARGGCRPVARPSARAPARQAGVPFLVPPARGLPSLELRRLRPAADLTRQARRGFVRVWQRAWIACLFYERIRYNLLHPESRIPGHRIPASEILRMLNDCISPVDLVRDWPLLDGR
jgi:hypothetical protein